MRIALLLIVFSLLNANASVYSQFDRFSVTADGLQIKEVLKEMENNSSYRFFYTDNLAYLNNKIDLISSNASVEQVLDEILQNSPLTYKVFDNDLVVILPVGEDNQQTTIKGKVSDFDGQPLPGVNVVEKGTGNGAVTDLEGNYTIDISSPNAILTFSFVGYITEEVEVAGQSTIDMVLIEDIMALDEVVVTALGMSREKKGLGYAVSEVKGDELALSSPVSPVSVLSGKAPGVQITNTDGGIFGGTRIIVRGNSTLRGNNQPIFVVDGIVIDNAVSGSNQWGGLDWGNELKNLNPDDFESVSVLKGAAATALYGSRALNGVVMITTKQGKKSKGLGVEINHTTSWETAYDGHGFQDKYGSGYPAPYASYLPNAFKPDSGFPTNSDGDPYIPNLGSYSWGPKMDGQDVIGWDGEWTKYNPSPTNYIDAFETGLRNNTNIALSGGTDRAAYRLSYSYSDQSSVYINNNIKKNSISSNISYDVSDRINVNLNLGYTNSVGSNPPDRGMIQQFVTWTFPRDYDTKTWYKRYKAPHGGVHREDKGDPYYMIPGNSFWFNIFEDEQIQTEDNTRLRTEITGKVTDWITAKAGASFNLWAKKFEKDDLGDGYQMAGGSYELRHDRKFQNAIDAQLIFNRELVPDLNWNFVLGGESFYSSASYSRNWTNGGLEPAGFFALSASKNNPGSDAAVFDERMLLSAFYIMNFDYKGQFFIDLTGRNDWSSTMVYRDGSGKYSYFYPSFTGSWIASETFDMPSFISFAKARLAYAIVGTGTDPYTITNPFTYNRAGTLSLPTGGDVGYYTYSTNTVPNPDLEPEKKHEIEFGADIRFLDNRLGIDFTYYDNHTYNQIINLGVPSVTGVSSIMENAGDIQNKGVEIALSITPVKTNDMRWDINVNYTKNMNKIVELYEDLEIYNLYESATYGNTRIGSYAFVGGDYGVLMSDSKPLENDEGEMLLRWDPSARTAYYIRSNEVEKVGTMLPKYLLSGSSTFSWKNLSLNVLIDAKIGGNISTYSGRYGAAAGLWDSTTEGRNPDEGGVSWNSTWDDESYGDGVIPSGVFEEGTVIQMIDGAGANVSFDVSGMTYQEAFDAGMVEPSHASYFTYINNSWGRGVVNNYLLMDNSYVSLREVSLGFSVPSKLSSKIGLKDLNIMLYGRDLLYLYNGMKDNLHPETQSNTSSGAAHEWGQRPYTRLVGVKLNVKL